MPALTLHGLTLHYEEHGTGTPILLLHGLGSSGHDWELVAPLLAGRHRVLIPDVRGHGKSDKPPGDYGVPLFAADLAAFCDALGLRDLHVVGLSMGGMIAFQLAVSRPDLVRSLVIVNSGPDMTSLAVRFAVGLRMILLRVFGPQRIAAMLAPRLFPKPEQAALRLRLQEAIGKNDPDVYRRATRGLVGWSVLAELPKLRCPVLILASERDYTPLSAKQAYAARLKDARVEVISDSGHAAPLDQPEQVANHVERFLTERFAT